MIDALFIFIAAIAHGIISAPDDTEAINTNKPIYHRRQWIGRALVALAVLLLFGRIGIAGALLYAGAWTPVFRYTLNRLRLPRKRWDYISPSNIYDSFFIDRFGSMGGAVAYAVEVCAAIAGALMMIL